MKNKHYILIIILLYISIGALAQNMYVRTINGTQDTYSIQNVQKITFPNGNVEVITNSGSNTYNFDDVRFIAFINYNVGIVAFDDQNRVTLYPNPVSDQLNIRTNSSDPQSCTIEIYTLEGRLIHHENVELTSEDHSIQVSNFASGVYLCKINNGTKISTTKFIKQ